MSLSHRAVVSLRRVAWIVAGLVFAAVFWVLNIELTYERNIRHGIPADFRMHRSNSVHVWRT